MKTKESKEITKRLLSRSNSKSRGSEMLKMMDEATTATDTKLKLINGTNIEINRRQTSSGKTRKPI